MFEPLRLRPGDDLRAVLAGRTGFVVAGIGSLRHAELRLADARGATHLPGPLEILTLSGSLTPAGVHLHASLSDGQGRVLGGHVCFGCEVHTTVELLIAPLPPGSLTRAPDAGTGYDELVILKP
jgi:predicted DNA-binding protein with PD1-like motif